MPALKIKIFFVFTTLLILLLSSINAAPTFSSSENTDHRRQAKNLAFLDYLPQETADYQNYGVENDQDEEDYGSFAVNEDENELSRSIPNNVATSRKRIRPSQSAQFNSPIYYIRLPPQPMNSLGLGYMSQPAPNPMSQFLNIPVNFVSNGKPNSIYQWTGGIQIPSAVEHPQTTQKPKPVKKPLKTVDSTIHRLPGQFTFNGRPDDIYVLGDSYNSLYGDVLQNLYP